MVILCTFFFARAFVARLLILKHSQTIKILQSSTCEWVSSRMFLTFRVLQMLPCWLWRLCAYSVWGRLILLYLGPFVASPNTSAHLKWNMGGSHDFTLKTEQISTQIYKSHSFYIPDSWFRESCSSRISSYYQEGNWWRTGSTGPRIVKQFRNTCMIWYNDIRRGFICKTKK